MTKSTSLYIETNSFFHRLNPAVKLIMFILWLITVFMFLDLRISIGLLVLGFIMLHFAAIPFKTTRKLFIAVIVFNLINAVFILLLASNYGVTLTGNSQILANLWGYKIYYATFMYVVVISLKYLSLLPLTLIFIFTTHPSKFAASLNKIGVPYKFAYTLNLMFRYFPEIQHEFITISQAQAMRGLSYSKEEKSRLKRIRNLFNTTIPLLNSSLEKIERIANAMELRSFGKLPQRTWYNSVLMKFSDWLTLLLTIAIFLVALYLRFNLSQKLYI